MILQPYPEMSSLQGQNPAAKAKETIVSLLVESPCPQTIHTHNLRPEKSGLQVCLPG